MCYSLLRRRTLVITLHIPCSDSELPLSLMCSCLHSAQAYPQAQRQLLSGREPRLCRRNAFFAILFFWACNPWHFLTRLLYGNFLSSTIILLSSLNLLLFEKFKKVIVHRNLWLACHRGLEGLSNTWFSGSTKNSRNTWEIQLQLVGEWDLGGHSQKDGDSRIWWVGQ